MSELGGWVRLPDGDMVRGQYPGGTRKLLEHRLSDELARHLNGATEAVLPYGRADVLTTTTVFEVEPERNWRHAVRQVLAYAAQCEKQPAIALFGAAHRDEVLKRYLRLRDGTPPVELWWWDGVWRRISSRAECRNMRDVSDATREDEPLEPVMTGAELARTSRAAQGLPEHVEDVTALAVVAAVMGNTKAGTGQRKSNGTPLPRGAAADSPTQPRPTKTEGYGES